MENKSNIILVEDNKDHQKLLQIYLENTIINMEIANNVQELMRKLRKHTKYDLVLLDIQLPKTDGYTITEKLRKDKKNKDLIIIGLSAFAMSGDKEKAIAKGMNEYLTKPIDKATFLNTLNKYLTRKEET
jgi:CheY-like chemotaxis protein